MIRPPSIVICLLFFLQTKAQDSTSFYLQKVVLEMKNNFQGLKGHLFESDSTKGEKYFSLITIPGTSDNTIEVNKWAYSYFSIIEDSLRQNQAERIVDKWYKILESSTRSGFKINKLTRRSNVMMNYMYGWSFDNNDCAIIISSYQSILNPKMYSVSLNFINPLAEYD